MRVALFCLGCFALGVGATVLEAHYKESASGAEDLGMVSVAFFVMCILPLISPRFRAGLGRRDGS